jgi:hypothetical protein
MKLKQKPLFTGNDRGHCAIYAIANALHGFPNAKKAFAKFPQRESGYMVSEQAEMVEYISSNTLKLAILYYAPAHYAKEELFRKICPYKELAEDISGEIPDKILFAPIIFYVISINGEMHAISAYYCFDSDTFICMDSAGEGSISIKEVADFFKRYKVYGICSIVQYDEESQGHYPAAFEKSELKIYE